VEIAQAHCLAGQNGAAAQVADYVFKNGKVYTLDAKQPWVESVAVKGNRVAFVGSNHGSTGKWVGPKTKVVDLKGRMLMPGFIEGHNHYVSGAGG
jgi:predicted amidohydrolase YtcJ